MTASDLLEQHCVKSNYQQGCYKLLTDCFFCNLFRRNISKYWSREWNYKYGNCFTFNRGIDEEGKPQRVFRATKPGPSQGKIIK